MNLALLARHLSHQRTLLLVLAFGLAGFEVLLLHIGAAFELGAGLGAALEVLPGFVQSVVRTHVQEISFPAVVAFGFTHPAVLVALFGQVLLATTTLAGDRERGLLDLLVARGLPRRAHVLAALGSAALSALLLPACMLAGVALGLSLEEAPGERPWSDYAVCAALLSCLLLAAGGGSLLLAAGARRRGTAVARMLGLLVVAYLFEFLADLWAPLDRVRWLSPFHYFHPVRLISGGAFGPPWRDALVLLSLAVAANLAALRRFERQDL